MAYRQLHLNKSGSGMASKTACGRNILRTPLSANWEDFKAEPAEQQCVKCKESKQAALNAKVDAKKTVAAPLVDDNGGTEWIAIPAEETAARDAELIAAHRAKKAAESEAIRERTRSATSFDIYGGDRP